MHIGNIIYINGHQVYLNLSRISYILRILKYIRDIMISSQDIRDVMDIKGYQQYRQGYLKL